MTVSIDRGKAPINSIKVVGLRGPERTLAVVPVGTDTLVFTATAGSIYINIEVPKSEVRSFVAFLEEMLHDRH